MIVVIYPDKFCKTQPNSWSLDIADVTNIKTF